MRDVVLFVLQNGDYIIGQCEEDVEGIQVTIYNGFSIIGDCELVQFPRYTTTRCFRLFRESVLTVIEDLDSKLLIKYLEIVGDSLINIPKQPIQRQLMLEVPDAVTEYRNSVEQSVLSEPTYIEED